MSEARVLADGGARRDGAVFLPWAAASQPSVVITTPRVGDGSVGSGGCRGGEERTRWGWLHHNLPEQIWENANVCLNLKSKPEISMDHLYFYLVAAQQ